MKKMKKFLFIAAALFSAAVLGNAQQLQQLPLDPAVRVGKLDNGLTYYIRHNEKPAQRAEFYLATDVGALQELPDQDGLAHFLEHMCFNGTKNFPGKGILNWLESIGASFGGNVNASTGVEQTIYLLNNIPLVRPTVVDTCILIMHDYSHFVTCDPTEIDKERGVILEEKRSRNDASWRMREQSYPYIFGDTKYATTTIIGTEENLKTFKPESLTNFYHTWYRPDMQALIVVGDIDVDYVEACIKRTFADIPAAENPKQKDVIAIPGNEKPAIAILTDSENRNTSVTAYWRSEATPEMLNSTPVGLITDLLEDIVTIVMDERFNEIAAQPDAPFLNGGFGIGNLCETADVVMAQVACKDGAVEALTAFAAGMMEAEKLRRFGFTDAEVERAKTELLSQFETKAKKAETRTNSEFVMPLIYNFFDNERVMDPQAEYELVQQLMPMLTTDAINQAAQQLITRENLVVIYQAPEKEGLVHPTAEQIQAVIDAVENAEIEQAAGEEIPEAFLDPATLKGSKNAKIKDGIYGSKTFTLKNGLRVWLLPTDYEKDRIVLNYVKNGGRSLLSDEELFSFDSNIWELYLQNSGVAEFPATMVRKMLSGKQVSGAPYVSEFTHGFSGSSTVKDLEVGLQLFYLYLTQPRFDETEYNQGISQIQAVLPNLMGQSNYKLNKALYDYVYDSPRRFMIDDEVVAKASLAQLESTYKRLFADVAGANLVIAGDFNVDEVLPLICKYAGSLPMGKKATVASYRGDGVATANRVYDFKAQMATPMVTVVQTYNALKPYSVADEAACDALSYILDMLYTETLREDEGGTYGASSNVEVTGKPDERHVMQIAFQTNVESADKLRELAKSGFKGIAENGPTADQFDKAQKNLLKKLPESRQRNTYWNWSIRNYIQYGFDYDKDYEAAVNALTPAKIQAAAQEFFDGNMIELVMRPEE